MVFSSWAFVEPFSKYLALHCQQTWNILHAPFTQNLQDLALSQRWTGVTNFDLIWHKTNQTWQRKQGATHKNKVLHTKRRRYTQKQGATFQRTGHKFCQWTAPTKPPTTFFFITIRVRLDAFQFFAGLGVWRKEKKKFKLTFSRQNTLTFLCDCVLFTYLSDYKIPSDDSSTLGACWLLAKIIKIIN